MPKIKVEIEVPNGEYCLGCEYVRYVASYFAVCTLFDNAIVLQEQEALPKRCDKCKQAEVKDEHSSN